MFTDDYYDIGKMLRIYIPYESIFQQEWMQ